MYTTADFVNDVFMFNDMSGQSTEVSKQDLLNQLKLCSEELNEAVEGVETDNKEEILDGTVDLLFVAFGLMQKLHHAGYNVIGAMQTTADNNKTKFPTSGNVVEETLLSIPGSRAIYNDHYNRWVILDENNKVRKPVGYVKNNLKQYLPRN